MTGKPKIVVSGANGQLGKTLKKIAPDYTGFEFIFLSKEDLKIQHPGPVKNFFDTIQPDFFINCAAYTAVDKAEQEKELAYKVNGEAVGVLAAVCKEHQTKLIHISTDYVFDGAGNIPYTEDDKTNPQCVYGASKLLGEHEAIKYNTDTIIIRTSWVYSEFGKNFVKTMIALMREKESISVVSDQIGSPTYTADLANIILKIISFTEWLPGIYHYSTEGNISWYDFAIAIKELTGSSCKVSPILTEQYPTPAKRPAYSVLAKNKIRNTFNIDIPAWKQSLSRCLKNINI